MERNYLKFLMAMVVILFATNEGFSQETQAPTKPTFKKHEFNLSLGAFPTVGLWNFYPNILGISEISKIIGYHKQVNFDNGDSINSVLFGAFNFRYLYNISNKTSVGFNVSYSKRNATVLDDGYHIRFYDNYFIFSACIRWKYLQKKNISLYYAISPGFTIGYSNRYAIDYYYGHQDWSRSWFFPSIHITCIGIQLFQKMPIVFELGFGHQGLLKFGLNF
jgi:hypothetical protein